MSALPTPFPSISVHTAWLQESNIWLFFLTVFFGLWSSRLTLKCVWAQLCLTLCNSVWLSDCSSTGSSVHGTLQARVLEWVAMPSSRRSSQPRDWTCISGVSCTADRFFTTELSRKPFTHMVGWNYQRMNDLQEHPQPMTDSGGGVKIL